MKKIPRQRTRFAPSPSGYLHLGHLASALYVWAGARFFRAKVLIRIEDHDRQRSRLLYEKAILQDLEYFGFLGLDETFRPDGLAFLRQSDRLDLYEEFYQRLKQDELVYPCYCSRKQIIDRVGRPDGELVYDGYCRGLVPKKNGPFGIRCYMPDQVWSFQDLKLGMQSQNPAKQCGDLLIKDRHDNWTYNFCVAVDDYEQGVDLIIRGQDITHATARQLQLRRFFSSSGKKIDPLFLHHSLIMQSKEKKMSKKDSSTSLRERIDSGDDISLLIGEALFSVGVLSEPRPLEIHQALSLLEKVFKGAV